MIGHRRRAAAAPCGESGSDSVHTLPLSALRHFTLHKRHTQPRRAREDHKARLAEACLGGGADEAHPDVSVGDLLLHLHCVVRRHVCAHPTTARGKHPKPLTNQLALSSVSLRKAGCGSYRGGRGKRARRRGATVTGPCASLGCGRWYPPRQHPTGAPPQSCAGGKHPSKVSSNAGSVSLASIDSHAAEASRRAAHRIRLVWPWE